MSIDTASCHHLLRQATADAHARIDAIVGGGVHSHVGYAAYLQGMQQLVSMALQAMPGHPELELHQARLASDLSALRMDALPRTDFDSRADARVLDPVARMGWDYVISGASVGARYLLRQVQALGYSADHGASFLAGHAGGDAWPRFLSRLAQADFSPSQRQTLCSAALAAKAHASRRRQRRSGRASQPRALMAWPCARCVGPATHPEWVITRMVPRAHAA